MLRIKLYAIFIAISFLFISPVTNAEQVRPSQGLETYYIAVLSGSEREEVPGATNLQDAVGYLCSRIEQRFVELGLLFISCGDQVRPHPSNPRALMVFAEHCTDDGRDCSDPNVRSNGWYDVAELDRAYWFCPSSHPKHIDRNLDGIVDSVDWCEKVTICNCTDDLDSTSNQCIPRNITWNGGTIDKVAKGLLVELSNGNNQGRQCGRVVSDEGCPEGEIQNLDEMGNPISCASGKKMQSELDYQASVGSLNFIRTYIQEPEQIDSGIINLAIDQSSLPSNVQMISRYQDAVGTQHYNFWTPNIPQLSKTDNNVSVFSSRNSRGGQKVFNGNAAITSRSGELTQIGGTTIHRTIGGTEYHFNSDNKIVKKLYRNGQYQDYTYPSADRLVITDNFGRSLTLDYVNIDIPGYGTKRFVSKMTDPAGQEYIYQYGYLGLFYKVIYPDETPSDLTDNPYKTYGYKTLADNRQGLLLMNDELGVKYANWDYDNHGRAILSEHAGSAEKVTIAYTNPTQDVASSSVKHYRDATNYTETLYDFKKINGAYKPLKISTQPCSGCSVGETNYQYDSNGYLNQVTQPDGTITQYQYNTRGLQESRIQALGTPEQSTILTVWHSSFNLPLSVDEPQRLTTYSYDANGNLLSRSIKDKVTNEIRTISYTYNSVGQVLTVDGARTDVADITTYEYDVSGNGNLVRITNALGHETLITAHDAHGKPLSVTDPNGTVTSMTYHPRGWLTSVTTDGDTTTYSYDKAGQLTSVTMANGVVLNYEYDAAHRLTAIVDAQGNRIEYTLDYMGNRTRTDIKDPSGTIKSFAASIFNDLGRLKETLGANSQSNKVNYDAEGYPTDKTDALNNVSSNQYDALDRLTKVIDPDLGETEFGYDNHNRLTTVTDATKKTTSYVYNAFGDVVSQTSPDTGVSNFTYDTAGNLLSSTDARGITVTYSYDALNRVISVNYPNPSESITYSYDFVAIDNKGIGRLTKTNDESGSTSYTYDSKGQLVSEIRVINNASFETKYGYDNAGLLVQVTYPSGREINYLRNNLAQVIEVTSSFEGVTKTVASNINYLPFGPMKSLTYGNGKILTQIFDQDYRLTNKSVTGINDLSYSYTPRDNVSSIIDSFDASFDQNFQYDNLQRLTDATGQYGIQKYSFDGIGNRLTKTQDGLTESYQYDGSSHHLAQAGNKNFAYDAVGNTLAKDDLSFTYNQMSRMVAAEKLGMTATYLYNASGERVKKDVNGQVTLYHYDQAGQLLAESNVDGSIIHEYIYLDGMRLAVISQVQSSADINNRTNYFDGENGSLDGWTIFDNDPIGAAITNEFDAELNSNVIVLSGTRKKNGFRLKKPNGKNWNNQEQFNITWQQKTSVMNFIVKVLTNEGPKSIKYISKTGTNSISTNGNAFKIYLGNEAKNNNWQTFTRDLQADLSLFSPTIQLVKVKFIQVKGHGRLDNIALFGQKESGQEILYTHTNHIGAPIALSDELGVIMWKGSYDPYGNLSVQVNNVAQNLRFPGQIEDVETGLYYNYFRDYDPELGRYLQSDPIGLNGGINTYAYVGGNPVNFIDPLGLWSTKAHNYLIRLLGKRRGWSDAQIGAVQNGSKFADNFFRGHQSGANAFMHAMTSDVLPNKQDACKKSNDYINEKLKKFNAMKGQNSLRDFAAYSSLGMALHTVMDNHSPAHAGFQKWDNSQIPRHGDNIPLTPFGSKTEEDLDALLKQPELIKKILDDMDNTIDSNKALLDCLCELD